MKKKVERSEIRLDIDVDSTREASQPSEPKYTQEMKSLCEKETQANAIEVLKFKLDEKNRKIEQLCLLLEALEPIPGVEPCKMRSAIASNDAGEDMVDLRDAKIVSLAKKSHNLNMLLNKEKSVNERLRKDMEEESRKVAALSQEIETLRSHSITAKGHSEKQYNRHALISQAKAEVEEESLQTLQRNLKDSLKSLEDLKKKNKHLVDENKHLAKSLAKELGAEGEGIDITFEENWRGRAQTIIMLKAKVKNLEAQLGSASSVQRLGVDQKAEEGLQEMSRERRQVVEALTEERVRLVEHNQVLERKVTACKARIQVLEGELKRLKDGLQVALEKSSTDDQLLDALRGEVQRLQQQRKIHGHHSQNATKKQLGTSEIEASEFRAKEMQYDSEIRRLQRLVRSQNEQLDAQDVIIRDLRKHLEPK